MGEGFRTALASQVNTSSALCNIAGVPAECIAEQQPEIWDTNNKNTEHNTAGSHNMAGAIQRRMGANNSAQNNISAHWQSRKKQ